MGGLDSSRDLNDNWKKWREYTKNKSIVTVEVDEYAIHANVITFKTHRDFITHLFKERGYEVTQFGHKYAPNGSVEKWGLVFERADSDIRTLVLVKGIIGENIRPILGVAL